MKRLYESVARHKERILAAERYIWQHPETGFREFGTTAYLAEQFRELGYENLMMAGNIPGFYTVVDTGRPGPEVLIMAEMDSLICPKHPESDPVTGAVHSCGHHAQCAMLLGIAAALKEPGVLDALCGRIRLCAVPAEELIEIEYRTELKEKGIIRYYGGKGEFLSRGYFDGVDMAFMVHSAEMCRVRLGSVGCIAKSMIYKGVPAHGAGAWEGKNALYAAMQGLSAANALRETFREEDKVRFHPIVTHGGEAVNQIPDKVVLESYVRAASFEAMVRENRKINMALCSAAMAIGCQIQLDDFPGYAPLYNDRNMIELAREAMELAVPGKTLAVQEFMNSGSTDMGELCGLMPVVHPYMTGAVGTCHGDDYRIADPYACCVEGAIWQMGMLKLLLGNGAERAKRIIAEYKPQFESKEAYLAFVDGINCQGDRITYNEDGTVTVRVG